MSVEEQYEATLKDIEGAFVAVYRRHPDLTDYCLQRALDAAVQLYKDRARGHPERPPKLTGVDVPVFDGLHAACDRWLAAGAGAEAGAGAQPLKPDEILLCLKRLQKSVEFWNKESGRQGYLNYIRQWIK